MLSHFLKLDDVNFNLEDGDEEGIGIEMLEEEEEDLQQEYERLKRIMTKSCKKSKRVPLYMKEDYPRGRFIYDAKEVDTGKNLDGLIEDLRFRITSKNIVITILNNAYIFLFTGKELL